MGPRSTLLSDWSGDVKSIPRHYRLNWSSAGTRLRLWRLKSATDMTSSRRKQWRKDRGKRARRERNLKTKGNVEEEGGNRIPQNIHLHVWVTSCPFSHANSEYGGRVRVLLQEIKGQYLLVGRAHVRKSTDEAKGAGAEGGEEVRWSKRGRCRGGKRRKDGVQRGRKCHPSVYIRGTFASSLWQLPAAPRRRRGDVEGEERQIEGGLAV